MSDLDNQRKYCCYKCSRKQFGCHSTCSDYAAFKKEMAEINKRRKADTEYRVYTFEQRLACKSELEDREIRRRARAY